MNHSNLFLVGLLLAVLGATLAAAGERIYAGLKNAVFYAKAQAYVVPRLAPYIENLHRIEAPRWYVHFLQTFLLVDVIAAQRGLNWYQAPAVAYLLAQGASTLASYWYQGYINIGCNLPWVDPNENPKAEFALSWPVKVSFWWPRPWCGTRRKLLPVMGLVLIAAGLAGLALL